jgi:hypothetical protein
MAKTCFLVSLPATFLPLARHESRYDLTRFRTNKKNAEIHPPSPWLGSAHDCFTSSTCGLDHHCQLGRIPASAERVNNHVVDTRVKSTETIDEPQWRCFEPAVHATHSQGNCLIAKTLNNSKQAHAHIHKHTNINFQYQHTRCATTTDKQTQSHRLSSYIHAIAERAEHAAWLVSHRQNSGPS